MLFAAAGRIRRELGWAPQTARSRYHRSATPGAGIRRARTATTIAAGRRAGVGIGTSHRLRSAGRAPQLSQRDVVPGRGTSISTSARPRRSAVAVATSTPSITKVSATLALADSEPRTRFPVSWEPPSRTQPPLRQRRRRRPRSAGESLYSRCHRLAHRPGRTVRGAPLGLARPDSAVAAFVKSPARALSWPLSCTAIFATAAAIVATRPTTEIT